MASWEATPLTCGRVGSSLYGWGGVGVTEGVNLIISTGGGKNQSISGFRGCTGGASRQDDHAEESSAGAPWWATGDWLQTGSRLTGLRSLETGRSPVESKEIKTKKTVWIEKKKKSKSEFCGLKGVRPAGRRRCKAADRGRRCSTSYRTGWGEDAPRGREVRWLLGQTYSLQTPKESEEHRRAPQTSIKKGLGPLDSRHPPCL